MSLLEGTSKTTTVPSMTPHARRFPSGLKATLSTNFSRLCFSSACGSKPKRLAHQRDSTCAESALLDASALKGSLKATRDRDVRGYPVLLCILLLIVAVTCTGPDIAQEVGGGSRRCQGQDRTEGMPRWPRGCVSTTSQSTTLLLLPPAAASIRLSLCGWNLICQVSDGGVSITAFVLLSYSEVNMLLSYHQGEDIW